MQIDKDLDEKLSSFHDTLSEYAYAGGTGNNDFNHPNADVTSVQSSKSSFYNYQRVSNQKLVFNFNRENEMAQSNNSPNISHRVSNYVFNP